MSRLALDISNEALESTLYEYVETLAHARDANQALSKKKKSGQDEKTDLMLQGRTIGSTFRLCSQVHF
jgi:hypothetical protein